MARARNRGDDGLTLVEILVAIVVLGVCVVSIVASTTTLTIGADVHRKDATVDTTLKQWGEAVKGVGWKQDTCSNLVTRFTAAQLVSGGYLPSPFPAAGSGLTTSAPVIRTWDGTSASAFTSCANSQPFVRVSLSVSFAAQNARAVTTTLDVVVSKP